MVVDATCVHDAADNSAVWIGISPVKVRALAQEPAVAVLESVEVAQGVTEWSWV